MAVLADGTARTVGNTVQPLSGFVFGFRLNLGWVFRLITLLNPDYSSSRETALKLNNDTLFVGRIRAIFAKPIVVEIFSHIL